MHPHNRADIPRQVPPTSGHCQILARIQPIRVHHKVPVILVNRGRLAPILAAEEFGEGTTFEWVNGREGEPGGVGGDDEWVCLGREVGDGEVVEDLGVVVECVGVFLGGIVRR